MRTLAEIGEFGLIDRLNRLLPTSPAVVQGIGDDCAIVRIFDKLMAVSTDMSIQDVHFRLEYTSADHIGWKAAASSLSDLAAMGATPMFALVSLSCPPEMEVHFIENLYHGISGVLSKYGVIIIGGDTTGGDKLILDVIVIGAIRGNRFLRRSGALDGDVLAVTGTPGIAAAGLHALNHGHDAPHLAARHFQPHPRVPEGHWLCLNDAINSAIDVSDGLFQDAGHLSRASGLGVDIQTSALKPDGELEEYCAVHDLDPIRFMLTGGEDYELLFSITRDQHEETLDAFHQEFRTPVHVIGEFTDAWEGVRINGEEASMDGFTHFKTNRLDR